MGPVIEEVSTTRPWSDRLSHGRQALTERKLPLRLVAITESHAAGSMLSIFVCGNEPALAQRISTPPKAAAAAVAMAWHASQSLMSAAKPRAPLPNSRAQVSASSIFRE